MTAATSAVGETLDALLTSPSFFTDPYPAYARLRDEAPVHWCEPWGAWVLTRHDIVSSVVKDQKRFASGGYELRVAEGLERQFGVELPEPARALRDEDRHHRRPAGARPRSRRPIVRGLGPRVLAVARPVTERLVREHLEAFGDADVIDLVPNFSLPVPARLIAGLLGVPERDQADVLAVVARHRRLPRRRQARRRPCAGRRAGTERVPRLSARADRRCPRGGARRHDGHPHARRGRRRAAERRGAHGHRRDAGLRRARDDREHRLERRAGAAGVPRPAGRAARRPGAARGGDRGGAPLQRLGPARAPRRPRRRRAARARRSPAATSCSTSSAPPTATRAPGTSPTASTCRAARRGTSGFGYGPHFCVGSALARMEAPIMLGALLERYASIELEAPAALGAEHRLPRARAAPAARRRRARPAGRRRSSEPIAAVAPPAASPGRCVVTAGARDTGPEARRARARRRGRPRSCRARPGPAARPGEDQDTLTSRAE